MTEKPFLIFIDGPMGSGKTTTSTLLAEKLPGTARIALADVKRFISQYETDQRFSRVSQDVIKKMADEYLSQDIPVIVECIAKDESIAEFQDIAEKHNAAFLAYKLNAPKETLVARIQGRTREMMDVAELPQSKVEELDGLFQKNYLFHQEHGNKHTTEIDTSALQPEEVAARIINDLDS